MMEHTTLPLNLHQEKEESGKYITGKQDQKRTHKLRRKYKRSTLKKITKLKQRKSNILMLQMVKSKFEKRDSKSSFENEKEAGDKSSFHKCAVCDKSFSKVGNLNVHVLIHTEEKPYECPYCDRGFSHQSTLKSHILIHTGEKPYSCGRCMYSCRQAGMLNRHTRKKHCSRTDMGGK